MTPDRVHLVSEDGQVLEGDGQRHSEYPIHTEVMIARPDVGGVVHTHPPHAVALAATGQALRPVSHAANYFVPPDVPRFTGTGDLILSRDLGREVAAALGSGTAIFLVNHGIVTAGPDLRTATVAAVLLERACAQQMLTHAFGGWPTWSGPGESRSKRRNIYAEGQPSFPGRADLRGDLAGAGHDHRGLGRLSAARWGTDSRVQIARSSTLRALATRDDLTALSQRNFDAATFSAWFIAFTLNSP